MPFGCLGTMRYGVRSERHYERSVSPHCPTVRAVLCCKEMQWDVDRPWHRGWVQWMRLTAPG